MYYRGMPSRFGLGEKFQIVLFLTKYNNTLQYDKACETEEQDVAIATSDPL